DVDRRSGRDEDCIVDRHVDVAVPVAPVALVLGSHLDAPGPIVDDDLDRAELTAIAARALHRLDRHIVAGAAGDLDVAGDVRDAEAAVPSDLHLPREGFGLLGPVVPRPPLIGARRDRLDDITNHDAD